ncbi:Zinc knuckle [Fusarium agapanthi]|uniref:Zinc knuckle n=1 Tax=Fusarium agapanthi TaxID=1803897 RepID=A0A9P5BF85_9HYPO|nr:Zinc knuckle [Fusarium agapanthi]
MGKSQRRQRRLKDEEFLGRRQLIIDQENVKGSLQRARDFLAYQRDGRNGGTADIICGCDPSPRTPFRSTQDYYLSMSPSRALVESDNPDDPNRERKPPDKKNTKKKTKKNNNDEDVEPVRFSRVFFFIHKSIPKNRWNVQYHEGRNKDMVATLHLATADGPLAIHSVYNVNQDDMKIDIELLAEQTTREPRNIVMGDFNLHNILWSGPSLLTPSRDTPAGRLLAHEMITKTNMALLTKEGTITYTRGKGDDDEHPSCIDLTFVSDCLHSQVTHWGVFSDNPWNGSDHRPIRTVFDITPYRDDTEKFLHNKVKPAVFAAAIKEDSSRVSEMPLKDENDVEEYVRALVTLILAASTRTTPTRLVNPPPARKPMDPHLRQILLGGGVGLNIPASELDFKPPPKKPTPWREYLQQTGESMEALWFQARVARKMAQDRIVKCMPALLNDDGVPNFVSEEQKQDRIRCMTWTRTSDLDHPIEIPFPALNDTVKMNRQTRRFLEKQLTVKDIEILVRKQPSRKAPGHDLICIEQLKMGCKDLAPLIAYLFNACLRLKIFPTAFKTAITAMLPKSGKDSYDTVNSWRPIALLSVLGKLYEKILTERLKKFIMDYDLLPETQYGAPGKSTTHAIQSMIGVIHKAWSRKLSKKFKKRWKFIREKVTMMGLDVSGAYNCVDPALLLQMLADLGVAESFLQIMHSYLSYRIVHLRLPQSTSEAFYMLIGIPQGSPLSPLLFLIFTAPLLQKINEDREKLGKDRITIFSFSYVDDTYLLAVSNSYDKNCMGLKIFHDEIFKWASSVGLTFSPQKYTVMHFRAPNDPDPPCELLPDIDGLKDNPEALKKEKLKVLGVVLDPALTFAHHISNLEKKVNNTLRHFRALSGPTWGIRLNQTRRYYMSKIRPIISHACAAWFLHCPGRRIPWSLKPKQIRRLEKLQYKCLLLISGGIRGSSGTTVLKDMNIEGIREFLCRMSMSSRARNLKVRNNDVWFEKSLKTPKDKNYNVTAYQILDEEAYQLTGRSAKYFRKRQKGTDEAALKAWKVPAKRNDAVKNQAKWEAEAKCASAWITYRRKRTARVRTTHRPAAIEERRGRISLSYYKGLTRPQSTLALQLRTERIPLNGYLSKIGATRDVKVPGTEDVIRHPIKPACTCGHHTQTVYHLFMHCSDLHSARLRLIERIGALDWKTLLTKHLKFAVDWAMVYFNLGQFAIAQADSMFYMPAGGG